MEHFIESHCGLYKYFKYVLVFSKISLQEFVKGLKIDYKVFYHVSSKSNYILKTITMKYFNEPMDSFFHSDSRIL